MASPPTLHELYSVSDLHLGGAAGRQIFNQGALLAAFIDLLRSRPVERKVALVLNGDIVDFLAEPGAAYLRPRKAVAMLERIFAEEEFGVVLRALGRFVRTPNRTLVMCLGNHDVELALPGAQDWLIRALCDDDEPARQRVIFAMDGKGYECRVGPARAFCSHGNEVDSWNLVDYAQLERVKAGRVTTWDPNAGTQLVIDVMNDVKHRYPFVDLLKPETSVVPRLIGLIEPKAIPGLGALGPILYRKLRGSARSGFLGARDDADAERTFLRELVIGTPAVDAPLEDPLAQMEADFLAGLRPLQVLEVDGQDGMLGIGEYLWDRLRGRSPQQAMREALRDWLRGDATFDLHAPDETSTRMDETVDPGFDFVLAGHTHLARAIRSQKRSRMYYNSGSWIRLIRLGTELLKTDEAFAPVYAALIAGTMEALDATAGLVLLKPTVTRITDEAEGAVGDLLEVRWDGDRAVLHTEPGTHFVSSR